MGEEGMLIACGTGNGGRNLPHGNRGSKHTFGLLKEVGGFSSPPSISIDAPRVLRSPNELLRTLCSGLADSQQAFQAPLADGDPVACDMFAQYYPHMCQDLGLIPDSEQSKQRVPLGRPHACLVLACFLIAACLLVRLLAYLLA